jgi:hypothetical protein
MVKEKATIDIIQCRYITPAIVRIAKATPTQMGLSTDNRIIKN